MKLVKLEGQVKSKKRTHAWFAGDLNASVVRLDHGLNQTQAKSEASLRATLIATIQTIPYLRSIFGRDPCASIFDGYYSLMVALESVKIYSSTARSVLNSVIHQVCHHLPHSVSVGT